MGLTVKVFIGLEYECRRGHRFITAPSDKSSKSKSTITAPKVVTSDAPIYSQCPCRASSKF